MFQRDTYSRALQAVTAEARLGAKRAPMRDELRRYGRRLRPTSPAPRASARAR